MQLHRSRGMVAALCVGDSYGLRAQDEYDSALWLHAWLICMGSCTWSYMPMLEGLSWAVEGAGLAH